MHYRSFATDARSERRRQVTIRQPRWTLSLEVGLTTLVLLCGVLAALPFLPGGDAIGPAHAQEGKLLLDPPVVQEKEASLRAKDESGGLSRVDLSRAIEERTALLARALIVRFRADGQTLTTWGISLKDLPSFVVFSMDTGGQARAVVDAERIRQRLISFPVDGIPQSKSCHVLSTWIDLSGVTRTQTDCIASSGFSFDPDALALRVKEALEAGQAELTVDLLAEAGQLDLSALDAEYPTLTLLATGRSNFKGSGEGRKANVRKGLSEHLNNVFVPAGQRFSFNSVLGKGVTTQNGWKMALTIFDGTDLRPAPGGGICQVSTTFYRAALRAGLPILEQKNHSLYVSYYEAYAVGQDATVFPGKQDLVVENDTGGPLIVQSYFSGDDAFVNIFGIDDGRSVVLSGPYLAKTAPLDLRVSGRSVRANEIVWQRTVAKEGAEVQHETLVARYQAIPRTLSSRWQPTVSQVRGSVAFGSGTIVAGR